MSASAVLGLDLRSTGKAVADMANRFGPRGRAGVITGQTPAVDGGVPMVRQSNARSERIGLS